MLRRFLAFNVLEPSKDGTPHSVSIKDLINAGLIETAIIIISVTFRNKQLVPVSRCCVGDTCRLNKVFCTTHLRRCACDSETAGLHFCAWLVIIFGVLVLARHAAGSTRIRRVRVLMKGPALTGPKFRPPD